MSRNYPDMGVDMSDFITQENVQDLFNAAHGIHAGGGKDKRSGGMASQSGKTWTQIIDWPRTRSRIATGLSITPRAVGRMDLREGA